MFKKWFSTGTSKKPLGKLVGGASAALGLGAVVTYDLLQKRSGVLRNYPLIGHGRSLLLKIRPEIQQYFIERDWDGRPFDRTARELIYARSRDGKSEESFGTVHDITAEGKEWFVHSITPVKPLSTPPRVRVGGAECAKPYDMALLNVSSMSYGSLSANAIQALNAGAAKGQFAHDTGEGGISPHHLAGGGDLVWEIGTAYFGARTEAGEFDPQKFAERASLDAVKMVSLKLSQGAKPGIGGVLPQAKITAEIAEIRGVPRDEKCISPPYHTVFSTPVELIEFIATMRELAGGKPAGFKLCVTSQRDVLAICKAIHQVGTAPDFIIVDGSEGGTGAAPVEFEDYIGMPLTQGLMTVHNALVGAGLRDRIRIGAAGKIAEGSDIVRRLLQGADYLNSARAMMMALGCIQAMRCAENTCPVGVATQNRRRQRALHVPTKTEYVYNYQRNTVREALRVMAALGVQHPDDLHPEMLRRNLAEGKSASYAELYDWLEPGQLYRDPPGQWRQAWQEASPDRFGPRSVFRTT
ncbi:FMN-binding glutamate synthase family protein [Enteractinococcus coprophilus]|uniref:Glutamate synthase domain-containing protein 2 n=1 Tax=Enteractinococcus coprophilus TaxID=1027633 RepID=A0A543A0G1_9MICC|nr:FMN-binding glutamate synthase family protein [Enteractinococcus coprophilus]TQL65990.1 glutamate synthase domain-containing protein 2 [Enteractinococcus coprophilus]